MDACKRLVLFLFNFSCPSSHLTTPVRSDILYENGGNLSRTKDDVTEVTMSLEDDSVMEFGISPSTIYVPVELATDLLRILAKCKGRKHEYIPKEDRGPDGDMYYNYVVELNVKTELLPDGKYQVAVLAGEAKKTS